MSWTHEEILQTLQMTEIEHFDIRTVTMGVSLRDCASDSCAVMKRKVYDKITTSACRHVAAAQEIESRYGIRIANKRIAVTPLAIPGEVMTADEFVELAIAMDRAAAECGVDYIGGFSALVAKGMTPGDQNLILAIPRALAQTKHVCSSVDIGNSRAGINMDAVRLMGEVIKETARETADRMSIGCAKLVVFCNAVEDNPFIAGAFHGVCEPDVVVNVGISGPGVVLKAVQEMGDAADFGEISTAIKRMAFKITRTGELIGRAVADLQGLPFGVVDISLAPTPAPGDSVGDILESMGLERVGAHGTTAALALLNDAVKKGGMMASAFVGGMSGAFIPVSEDQAMIRAAAEGVLSIEKLEAMTCVCSVGLDMVAIPGDTPATTISAILADEAALGMVNNKTTAVRLIPAVGYKVGDMVDYGGLLGAAPIMPVRTQDSSIFIRRGGRIPAPTTGIRN
ncbi:MAG: PFL family protein [Candidatus Delongbacteria bacterium]|nr:PFL family protein [Candidatus Delongbacteria bacterium]